MSKHLKLLRERGFIQRSRFQNWSVYHLPAELTAEQASCLEAVRSCVQGEPSFVEDLHRLAELPDDCHPYEKMREVFPQLYASLRSPQRANHLTSAQPAVQ